MKIEPSEFLPIGNEFQKIFGISFGKFIDMRFLLARKELVFNFLKFTDWLEECYPDECSIDGVSYNAVVERKFGKRGVKMIKKLILRNIVSRIRFDNTVNFFINLSKLLRGLLFDFLIRVIDLCQKS